MSLRCNTRWACVSLLVQVEPRSGEPSTSKETQANPVLRLSDMVLSYYSVILFCLPVMFLSYLKRCVLGEFKGICWLFWWMWPFCTKNWADTRSVHLNFFSRIFSCFVTFQAILSKKKILKILLTRYRYRVSTKCCIGSLWHTKGMIKQFIRSLNGFIEL